MTRRESARRVGEALDLPREANGWDRLGFAALLIFGILFAVVTPPFEAPDEPEHFYRAFEISEGRLVPIGFHGQSGDLLPRSLLDLANRLANGVPFHTDRRVDPREIRKGFGQPLEPGKRIFITFLTSSYSWVPYLPPAAAIAIGRLFTDSVLALLYAGRLASVLFSTLLFAAALRVTPVGRPLFFLLAMAPMAVFLMASVTADAFTNGFCFFFIAVLLRFAFSDRGRLTPGRVAGLVLLSAVLGLTKPGYVLLPGLLLLLPGGRAGSRGRTIGVTALMLTSSIGAMLAWVHAIWRIYPQFSARVDIAPVPQLRGVLARPIGFAILAATQYLRAAPKLAKQYIGRLGWLDTPLPALLVGGVLLVIVLVALTCGCQTPVMRLRQRLLLGLVLFTSLAWITILLYAVFTPYGSREIVSEAQGRYFIPLGPLAFLLLYNRRWCIDWGQKRHWLVAWASLSLGGALAVVFFRYYA